MNLQEVQEAAYLAVQERETHDRQALVPMHLAVVKAMSDPPKQIKRTNDKCNCYSSRPSRVWKPTEGAAMKMVDDPGHQHNMILVADLKLCPFVIAIIACREASRIGREINCQDMVKKLINLAEPSAK